MAEEIRKRLKLSAGLEIWQVAPVECREQDINARAMTSSMFNRLTETIKRDGRLESLPLCAASARGLEIISGHHRIRAALAGRLETIFVLVDTTGLSPSQVKAKQLAHNAISGTDDPALLAEIFNQINTVEDMRESFVDLEGLPELTSIGLTEVSVDFGAKTVCLVFLPSYFDSWNELIATLPPQTDQIALVDREFEKKCRDAFRKVGKKYDIRAITPLICKFIDLANEQLTEA